MRKISIINEKGGIGKTFCTTNLATGLAKKGKRVLVVDLDPQGNVSQFFLNFYKNFDFDSFFELNIPKISDIRDSVEIIDTFLMNDEINKKDINNLLLEGAEVVRECIYKTDYENLDVIPSLGTELIKTDQLLKSDMKRLVHNRLKKALREIRKDYDFVLFDHAPTFNNITVNGLYASDEIIIPMKVGGFELRSFVNMMKELFDFEDEFEEIYKIKILMNMIPRGRRKKIKKFIEKMNDFFPEQMCIQTIGYQDSVASKSAMTGKPVIDTKTNVGNDYLSFVEEILKESEEY